MLIEGYEYDIVAQAYDDLMEGLIDASEMNYDDFRAFRALERSRVNPIEECAKHLTLRPQMKEFSANDIPEYVWEQVFNPENVEWYLDEDSGATLSPHFQGQMKKLASSKDQNAKKLHKAIHHTLNNLHTATKNPSHMTTKDGKKVEDKTAAGQAAKKHGMEHYHVNHGDGRTKSYHVIMTSKHPETGHVTVHGIAKHADDGAKRPHENVPHNKTIPKIADAKKTILKTHHKEKDI